MDAQGHNSNVLSQGTNSFGFLFPLTETSRRKNSPIWAVKKPDQSPSWTKSLPSQQNKFASMTIFHKGKKILQKFSRGNYWQTAITKVTLPFWRACIIQHVILYVLLIQIITCVSLLCNTVGLMWAGSGNWDYWAGPKCLSWQREGKLHGTLQNLIAHRRTWALPSVRCGVADATLDMLIYCTDTLLQYPPWCLYST